MKNAKVYVPSVSSKVLATDTITINKGKKVFIAVEIDGNDRYTHLMFDENGYKVDENGNKKGSNKVAFKVTEKNQAILSELYEKEFESGFNHNELIKTALEYMEFVPCLFSNTVKNEDLTKDNADCVGYVNIMPNAINEYKYFNAYYNVATGDSYKYATVLDLY